MKLGKQLKQIFAFMVGLVCITFASSTWAQSDKMDAANTKAGVIKIMSGDVWARDAQGERLLKAGDSVFAKDRLVSSKNGAASVVLRDGTTLILSENTQLDLQTFAFDATTQDGKILVNLLQGSMRVLTGLIAKVNPEAIQIKTKTLSVGIRGTDFIVETDEKV